MVCMAIGAWVILMSLVAYEARLGVPYRERIITISEDDGQFTQAVDPFSSISLPYIEYSKTTLWPETFGGIIINVCDTASSATVTAPQGLKKYLHCESSAGTLRLYMEVPHEDTVPGSPNYIPWPGLRCPQPIVITTPQPLASILSQAPYPIEISNMTTDDFTGRAQNGVTFKGCKIARMNAFPVKRGHFTLSLQGSSVAALSADSGISSLNISGDSASVVGSIEWPAESERGVRLITKGLTIGSVSAPLTSLEISVDSATVKTITSR